MKILILSLLLAYSITISAQDQLTTHMTSAQTNYQSGDLEETRFALQQSLNELYLLISKEVLAVLPQQLGTAQAVGDADQYNGALLGYTGVFIDRTYESSDRQKNINISLIHDSPLMSSLGSFLASPIMSMATGRKRLKVDGYKGALEHETDEYVLYVPFSQSLLTVTFSGYDSETEVIGLANQLPVTKVVAIVE
ncbi:MAG: hypothetical protein AAGI23_15515 [Bacteroidota bacterium]